MGSHVGDQKPRALLLRKMAAALTQRSTTSEQAAAPPRDTASLLPPPAMTQLQPKTTVGGNGDDGAEKQQRPRSPLPVGRFLQRGSLAPKRVETSVEMSSECVKGMVPVASCSSSGGEDTDAGEESGSETSATGVGGGGGSWSSRSSVCGGGTDAAIELAMALLRKLQQEAAASSSSSTDDQATGSESNSESGVVVVKKEELDQILAGFAKALESGASSERGIEDEMQQLFVSHANVFDESMQNYFIQNFIHEAECAKTFRAAVRRTSLVRRCLLAMYPAEKGKNNSSSSSTPTGKNRWSASLVARAVQHKRSNSLEVCPEVDNPVVIEVVKTELLKISSWDFNVFVIADAVPGQTLSIVGNALLEKYDFCCHFRSSQGRLHRFLRQIELKYDSHPYHNSIHAADVAQSLHHFLWPGNLGESFSPRTKCAAILAAIVHDVGHTSYSNNFHISINDDLAIQYVYRSPLEHMHCALAFQLLKSPKCNVLQGLTKIEQLEVRNLITDMVLATDNTVHSTYLAKLEGLVCRSSDEGWRLSDPDDEKLILQMALHAADVSNPAKEIAMCKTWADRIMREFYQQGDKERELQLPVSVGYDRENPIPVEKMQAGFIIGIVRPLFHALCQLPRVELAHCMTHLDDNLRFWQCELARNQPPSPPKLPVPAATTAESVS